jgi:hypothetical protein
MAADIKAAKVSFSTSVFSITHSSKIDRQMFRVAA